MANSTTHGSLPWIVKGARYSLQVSTYGTTGAPIAPTTPDAELSKDAAAFADCTEELTTINTGAGYITLTGDETNCTFINFRQKGAGTPSSTVANTAQYRGATRIFPTLVSGTAQAGAAGTITLASGSSAVDDFYVGCLVQTTGGTGGGGGSGNLGNQVRMITDYAGSTKVATIEPNWETTPDSTTTYKVMFTEMAVNCMVANVENWNGTAVPSEHTAGYPIVTVKDGTGTGEIDTTSGGVLVSTLATQAKADVNAEALDVLNTDTFAEPAQGAPGATVSLVTKIGFLYKAWRNKKTQTATQYSLLNDDAATVDHKATVADDGTTTTIGEVATGP